MCHRTDTGGRVRKGAVIRKRILGWQLRRLREEAGLTLEAAAPALEWSTSTLSRIETGQQVPDVHGLRSMFDLYAPSGPTMADLTTLFREVKQRGWWRAYGVGDQAFVAFENEATTVLDYTIDFVPGLLQTADYTRALLAASTVRRTETEFENAVSVRTIRQERLVSTDSPLQLTAIIDESVLHRPVGGPIVLAEQLDQLITATSLDSVTLQVLPLATAARAAMASGLTVLSFGALGEPDMAYVEHSLGAMHMDKASDVARAKLKFDRLRSDALSPVDSLTLIREVAVQA